MKRVFLRHDYRNKVIKLHNLIERLVTNRPLLKVSPLEAKEEQECIDLGKCGSCNLWGHGQWVTIKRSVHQLLFTAIIHVFEIEPASDSWERLAVAFHGPAAVQCSAEYHQSVKSSSSQLKTSGAHWDVMSIYWKKPCEGPEGACTTTVWVG